MSNMCKKKRTKPDFKKKKRTKPDFKKKKKRCACVVTSCSRNLRHQLHSLIGCQVEIGIGLQRTLCGTIVHVTKGEVKLSIHEEKGCSFVHISICHIDSVRIAKPGVTCHPNECRGNILKRPNTNATSDIGALFED